MFFRKISFLAALGCLFIGGPVFGQERLHVVAHMFPAGSPPDKAAQVFSERLAALGFDQARVVAGALLGDEQQNFRELGQDKISFAITGDLLISSVVPSFAAVNLPFTQTSMEHSLAPFVSNKTYSRFQELLSQYNVRHLATLCLGTRYLTSNTPISSAEDIRGLKLRLPNDRIWTSSWQAIGAEPINVPFPELLAALKGGLVDAQENPPALIRAAKLNEVQRYLVETKHYFQRQFILVSNAYFEGLSHKKQDDLLAAASDTASKVCSQTQRSEADAIEWLISEGGMELIEFNQEGISEIVSANYHADLANDADANVEAIVGIE